MTTQDARPTEPPRTSREPLTDATSSTKELLCELLRAYYDRNWVAGTGGGICGPTEDGNLFLAPTGVHKELVQPRDFFVVDPADGSVVRPPEDPALRPSECGPIFCASRPDPRRRLSSMHSHALIAVLAADLARATAATTSRSATSRCSRASAASPTEDVHLVPVIRNTPASATSWRRSRRHCATRGSRSAFAILVADHGAYIWGADVWETKRHAEVYHFLFEAVLARAATPSSHRPAQEERTP